MKVPNELNLLRAYSEGKCGNYSRNSVENIPRLWQKINLIPILGNASRFEG